jgi:hypothetical protein
MCARVSSYADMKNIALLCGQTLFSDRSMTDVSATDALKTAYNFFPLQKFGPLLHSSIRRRATSPNSTPQYKLLITLNSYAWSTLTPVYYSLNEIGRIFKVYKIREDNELMYAVHVEVEAMACAKNLSLGMKMRA